MGELFCVVIGVSRYAHLLGGEGPPAKASFGFGQLSSPAQSALAIFDWLRAAALPGAASRLAWTLAPPTLLVSPSVHELDLEPRLAGFAPASRASVAAAMVALRKAAATKPDAATLVYFAGHGLQRTGRDGLLLLEDFGDPARETLDGAVELSHLIAGMAPSQERPGIARTQLWWVDACRRLPEELSDGSVAPAPDVFDVPRPGLDDRTAPVFFAALPGAEAFARKRKPSVFCRALVRGLSGAAALPSEVDDGDRKWQVTVQSLGQALQSHLTLLAGESEERQRFTPDGPGPSNVLLTELSAPPPAELEVQLDPAEACDRVGIEIQDELLQTVAHPGQAPPLPRPYRTTLEAGVYTVSALAEAPLRSVRGRAITIKPPRSLCVRKVAP